jgi:hypothetical protein
MRVTSLASYIMFKPAGRTTYFDSLTKIGVCGLGLNPSDPLNIPGATVRRDPLTTIRVGKQSATGVSISGRIRYWLSSS